MSAFAQGLVSIYRRLYTYIPSYLNADLPLILILSGCIDFPPSKFGKIKIFYLICLRGVLYIFFIQIFFLKKDHIHSGRSVNGHSSTYGIIKPMTRSRVTKP